MERKEETVNIKQIERQLILYDVFRTLEKVSYRDIQFVLGEVEKRTLQRDLRDLTDAGLICVKYSQSQKAYIRIDEPNGKLREDINCSDKKSRHLKRLQRLAGCVRLVDGPEPVSAYFEMFPEASERMRQRDFETLRHIGFEAGYNREYRQYIINSDMVGPYDGYGVNMER